MHIPKFKLYRMGSDPEALFVKPVDFDWVITPAYDIIGRDKKKTTASFIGTDSRPVIAEIRPNPARNLKRHLYEVAYAIVTTQDFLDASPKWKGLKLLAYPHILGENLGGHIHASFFTNDPMYMRLKPHGLTVGTYNLGSTVAQFGGAPVRHRDLEAEVYGMMNDHIMPATWGSMMGWLLTPFEKWVQPWVAREARNAHYGAETSPDAVRVGTSHPPFDLPGMAYVHWEYRLPSTWLQHPWLAYSYLGLAKYALLNMGLVMKLWLAERPAPESKKKKLTLDEAMAMPTTAGGFAAPMTHFNVLPVGDPAAAGALLLSNLGKLAAAGARTSRDLTGLTTVLQNCGARRAEWFQRPQPIDVAAWRKLL